jgi:beta-1,4-mannosyl-glycoprotein beta-1,4-N-acetylglucosaminyltransferase
MLRKLFDCITFFRENFITNVRFEILYDYIDYFVICESIYDHNGNKKDLNFKLNNKNFEKKIIYIILDFPFPKNVNNGWKRQAFQRNFILKKLKNIDKEDYIMFSDPDEIPNPKILVNLQLKRKYGIFMQKHFVYKFNLYNHYNSPWEGTRICKFGNLTSIDYLRQKILSKNLKKWWRPDKEKNIELINNGGWHFKDILTPEELSIKLKTFAHKEFEPDKFSSIEIIAKKISLKEDLYNKNQTFSKVELNNEFPEYILNNKDKFDEFIEK